MKKMNFEQMEIINGGETVSNYQGNYDPIDGAKVDCAVAIALAAVVGTTGVIATAASGGAAAFIWIAMGSNWLGWIGAGYSCGRATGKF
jgi:hypothetical protein